MERGGPLFCRVPLEFYLHIAWYPICRIHDYKDKKSYSHLYMGRYPTRRDPCDNIALCILFFGNLLFVPQKIGVHFQGIVRPRVGQPMDPFNLNGLMIIFHDGKRTDVVELLVLIQFWMLNLWLLECSNSPEPSHPKKTPTKFAWFLKQTDNNGSNSFHGTAISKERLKDRPRV